MIFTDLKPDFKPNESPSSADRVIFLCPKCFHDDGTGPSDFTLEAAPGSSGRSSVLLLSGCTAHFHITNGEVIPSEAPGGGKSW